MTTQQQKPASAAAKNAQKAQEAKSQPKQDPKPAKAKAEAKAPAQPTYREVDGFEDALKSAKSAAKGNADLMASLQLLTHLSWKTPGGSVGWAKGTTQKVVDHANDLLVANGTPIPDAMEAVLGAATKAAEDKPQKDAVAVLSKIVKGHSG